MKLSVVFKWFFAFSKRLIKKPSFLLSLLIIPLVTLALSVVTYYDSGIMTVAIASRDDTNEIYKEISEELLSETSSIRFVECDSASDAEWAVRNGKAECAWVFEDNFNERLSEFIKGDSNSKLCEIIVKDDNVLIQLSREKLYGMLYKYMSYDIFLDFMNNKNLSLDSQNSETFKQYFDTQKNRLNEGIVEFTFYNVPDKKIEDANILASPLKGLLAVAMLLCCLAAMIYSVDDEYNGKYAGFPVYRRLFLHFTSVASASIFVSAAVIISLALFDSKLNLPGTVAKIFLYALMCIGFCVFLGIVCKKPARLCILLPVITVSVITLCPIFVNIKRFGYLKILVPTYHYLFLSSDASYLPNVLIYILVVFIIDVLTYKFLTKE